MKRTLTILSVLLFVGLALIPPTAADTSQGLFWKPDVGDQFHYLVEIQDEGVITTEEIYFEVSSAPPVIPDPLTNWTYMPYISTSVNWANGSNVGLFVLIFLFLTNPNLPSGNWDLMTSLFESSFSSTLDVGESSVDDPNSLVWGYSWTGNTSGYEYNIHTTYDKIDGFFTEYNVQMLNETTREVKGYYEVTRITQGLYWGHDVGDRFDFHIDITNTISPEDNKNEDFYMTINSLDMIPVPIGDMFDLPYSDADYFWANGSAEPSLETFFLYAFRPSFPTGNWTVYSELFESYPFFTSATADDTDPFFWELTWSTVDGNARIEVTTEVLKVDGVVSHLEVMVYNDTSDVLMLTLVLDRLGLEVYRDRIPPSLTHPADVEFPVGATDQNVTWTAHDDNPVSYEVYLDGVLNASGPWTVDGEHFVHSLDDFEPGTYNLTIVVTDIAGNTASDQVVVIVNEAEAGGIFDLITDNLLYIGIGVGAVIVIGAVVCMKRR